MKIAVISDIHGNFPALETVSDHIEMWKPDIVLVAGDIVNRGPRSIDCLLFLEKKQRENGWKIIRGNHEDYVISREDPKDPRTGPSYELYKPTHYIFQQLNNDVTGLKSLPEIIEIFSPQDEEIRMVHASMKNNRDGIYPETKKEKLESQISPAPSVFITGHTHRPFTRNVFDTLVVNAGSVGLPFDNDSRTGYAQIVRNSHGWKAEIIRLNYDIAQAEKDFFDSGYIDGAGPLANIVLLELRLALSQLYHWSVRYSKSIIDGSISVAESAEEYLQKPIIKPYW